MSLPVTILALDSQPVSNMRKILEADDKLVVVTPSPTLARHALSTMSVGVWVCDMATQYMDLNSLIAIAEYTSPGIRILLIGPQGMAPKAQAVIAKGGHKEFLAKPFNSIALKKKVADLAADYLRDSATGTQNAPKKSVVNVSKAAQRAVQSAAETKGPDPARYTLVELLGSGGTGTVFKAHDKFLDLDVAIKVINPDILSDAEILEEFKDEARIAMQMSHPGIMRTFNFSSHNGCYYLVMELISGHTLRDAVIRGGPFSPRVVCRILQSCASALDYAHAMGIVHNDLKPENIFVTFEGELKIIDFGTATLQTRVNQMTHICGTPEYMSPEQLRGERSGPQSDVYAFGIIMYVMLAGAFPFPPDTLLDDYLNRRVRPNFSILPEPIVDILERATHEDAAQRYASMAEFSADFANVCGYLEVLQESSPAVEIYGISKIRSAPGTEEFAETIPEQYRDDGSAAYEELPEAKTEIIG